MNPWALTRVMLWCAFLVGPWFALDPIESPWRHHVILTTVVFMVSLLWPLGLCGMIRIMNAMGSRQLLWHRPSISVSPIQRGNPLQFWWTVDIAFLAAGVSAILSVPIRSADHLKHGVLWLAAGAGGLLGIHICLRWYKKAFLPKN